MKTGNWKFHPAEGVGNVCCLFSFNSVNEDTSMAVKPTGQVIPPLGKPLNLCSFLLQRNPLFFHKLTCIFKCCGQASQAFRPHSEQTSKQAEQNESLLQTSSRLSGSRTAKVSNSLSKESKLGFRSQHNNIQIVAFLSALWAVFGGLGGGFFVWRGIFGFGRFFWW